MLTLNDGRAELWQWDTGRTLAVDADCSQVHFSNKVFGRSIDVDVTDGVAIIPDILLQTDKDLNVWAFVGTAENGYTKISKTFKVNRRNKPADYVFTPPEQTTLAELVGRLDRIEESQDPGAIKNAVEDYLEQNPVEAPVHSVNGRTGEVELTAKDVGAISQDALQEVTNEVLAQAKASGEFDGAGGGYYSPSITQPDENTMRVAFTPSDSSMPEVVSSDVALPGGVDGKSAYQYAVEGGYTGTETEFAAKLAEEMPDKLPNPNALTFTGAVAGSYDGSEPVTVEIPSGGPGGGGISAFEKIGTIDLSTMAANNVVEFTVTDVTEIVLIWTGMTNTTKLNSSLFLTLNSSDYYNMLGPRTGKAGMPLNGYTYLKVLENVGVLPIVSAGATSNENYVQGGNPCSYNLIPVKEKIQTFKIVQPSTQYYADAGTVEVYVR